MNEPQVHTFKKKIYSCNCFGSTGSPLLWGAFSSCGDVAVLRALIVAASLMMEHRPQAHELQWLQDSGSVVVAHGLRLQHVGSS